MAHSKFTSTTCPNCNTDFDSVPVEFDGPIGYAVLEVKPCADPDCGALLCACCSVAKCECCNETVCSEHVTMIDDLLCCRVCKVEIEIQVASEVASETLPAKREPQTETTLLPALSARCPVCESANLRCVPFDFGTCEQTGYHDAGESFECRACGATGDAGDVLPARVPELVPVRREVARAIAAAVAQIGDVA